MWNLLNGRLGPGETVRVFPLSNWTERDVWRYIAREKLDVVPLYFAARRPTITRNGQLARRRRRPPAAAAGRGAADEERTLPHARLLAAHRRGASTATDIESVVAETLGARTSERQGRLIDHDQAGAMERKKQEGYF